MTEHLKQNKEKQFLVNEKKREILLTIVLWCYMILAPLDILLKLQEILASMGYLSRVFMYRYHSWMDNTIFILHDILLFICCFAIWKWKKWGVYGVLSLSVIYGLLYLYRGYQTPFLPHALAIFANGMLLLLLFRVWKHFP